MSEQNGKSENVRPRNQTGNGQNTQIRNSENKEVRENRDGKNSRSAYNNGNSRGNGNNGYRAKGYYEKDRKDNRRSGKPVIADASAQNASQAPAHRERKYSGPQSQAETAGAAQAQRIPKNAQSAPNTENGGNENGQNVQHAPQNNAGSGSRYNNRFSRGYQRDYNRSRNIKVEETKEDIIRDIGRIEKEIELEIKEISALKFGI